MEYFHDAAHLVLLAGIAGLLAVASSRVARSLAFPAPALFLIAGVAYSSWRPEANDWITETDIINIGTFALVFILFEGGFHGGWSRTRKALKPILLLGIIGTFVTTAVLASVGYYLLGLPAAASILIAIALAPTDPAAVFSVLAGSELEGRSGIVLEGESGANDPVGIALMLGALEYIGDDHDSSLLDIGQTFIVELGLGVIVGIALGVLFNFLLTKISLGTTALHAFAGLTAAMLVYAATTSVHGSGFLAVFVAGLVIGDRDVLEHDSTETILSTLSALGEIVMFTVLGLTITLGELSAEIGYGIALFVAGTFIVRPVVTLALTSRTNLELSERWFISWGGLRGAVPILLASLPFAIGVDDGGLIYGTVFVAVTCSIIVQGMTLPALARKLRLLA